MDIDPGRKTKRGRRYWPADRTVFIKKRVTMCYYNAQKVTHAEFIRLKQLEKTIVEHDFFNRLVIVGFDFGPTTVLKPVEGREDFDIVQMEWGFLPDPLRWPFIETR